MEIIIPAYNCIDTIGDTLDSLVAQTNKNFTVMVVDDHSTQDIRSIIKNYQDKLNIKYIRNDKNIGCGMTRQRGMDETTADYIAFLDSDDVLLPDAVDIWTREIEKNHPEVIFSLYIHKKDNETLTYTATPLHVCHGKVYNMEFLRQYNIRESEAVKCADDLYLNLQAFDLANKVSILFECTYIYVDNINSVTHQEGFTTRGAKEIQIIPDIVSEHISLFKGCPLKNYKALERKIRKDLFVFTLQRARNMIINPNYIKNYGGIKNENHNSV